MLIIEPKIFTQYRETMMLFAGGNLLIFIGYGMNRIISNNFKLNNLFALWILYRVYTFIMMISRGDLGDVTTWGYLSLMVANIILIFDDCINKETLPNLLKAIMMVGILYLAINLWSLLSYDRGIITDTAQYANGDNDFYFLGIKVTYTSYIFAFLSASVAYSMLMKRYVSLIIILLLSVLNLIVSQVTTGTVMFIVYAVLVIVFYRYLKTIDIKIKWLFLVAISVNILFVFFNLGQLFEFVFSIFGKNSDLTGRTDIWRIGKGILFESPIRFILGHGLPNNGIWVPFGRGLWHAHNFLLQYLYEDGLVGICLLLAFLCFSDTGTKYVRSNKFSSIVRMQTLICAVIMMATITNSVFGIAHYYMPFLLIHCLKAYDSVWSTDE